MASAGAHSALVTGSTAGIGRALAELLAREGTTVGIVAREAARGEAVRVEIVSATGTTGVHAFVADLSNAFGASKAADLLFTFELARRLEGTGISANAVHPGLARTSLMRQAPAPLRWATRLVSATPMRAAADVAPLVLSPDYEGLSGRFFKSGRQIEPPPYTRDLEVASRLWAASASLTNLAI